MNLRSVMMIVCLLVLPVWATRAQWLTQQFDLKAGWNAIFLHVDPSHATIDEWVASDSAGSIQEVWLWRPALSAQQFVDSPQRPLSTDSRWRSWSRTEGPGSTLERMKPNLAYLVRVKEDVPSYTWALKGQPVAPEYQWTTSGLNFLGFPTAPSTPPVFDTFLSRAPVQFRRSAEFFRYAGGELGIGNPVQVFALRTEPMRRGEAYWIRSGDYFNRYFAPFEVGVSGSGQLRFGDNQRSGGVRISNLTGSELTVHMEFVASETPPAGEPTITGPVPLLIRGVRDRSTGTYSYTSLEAGTPAQWTLARAGADGSSIEVVLGVDRSVMAGDPGALRAGVLRFRDGEGQAQVDVGVSAQVGNTSGLWVGRVAVTGVAQYLKKYKTNEAGELVVGEDGGYEVLETDTSIQPVVAPYPLRLILHNPSSGTARLYQRVFTGVDAGENPVVSNSESVLDRERLEDARRISAPHLPFTNSNEGWAFDQRLVAGATLKTTVMNRFDDGMSNPFLHSYHPDHDNLNARFTHTLPQGSESYTIVREMTLEVVPPTDDFTARTSVGETVGGVYSETIRVLGLGRGGSKVDTRTFAVQGEFVLNRLSTVPVVSSAP